MPQLTTTVNPAGLPRTPAFAQGVITPPGRLLHIGGQNGIDAAGTLTDGLPARQHSKVDRSDAALPRADSCESSGPG